MSRINYIDRLNKRYQEQGFPPYKWSTFDDTPWTPFKRTLKESTIALISSGGIFIDDQEPFDPWAINDLSFREIPKDTSFDRLKLHHNYFDHRDALKDLNCLFPLERLQELKRSGIIGNVAPKAVTLGMGRLYKRTALQTETAPKIADNLKEQKADAVLLIAA